MKQILLFLFCCLLIQNTWGKGAMPVAFVANKRQWEKPVQYKVALPGGAAFLLKDGFTFNYLKEEEVKHPDATSVDTTKGMPIKEIMLTGHAYNVSFTGCNTDPVITGEDKQTTYYNYFIGKDSSKWAGNVPLYNKVYYKGLYPGIDLSVYSRDNSMEYDFIVAPGADAAAIAMKYTGVTPILTSQGNLDIKTSVNEIIEQAPYAYQLIDGVKKELPVHFKILGDGKIGFQLPKGYDKRYQLVIDPFMIFAGYSGGSLPANFLANGADASYSATYDADGNYYLGGLTTDPAFPATMGAYQQVPGSPISQYYKSVLSKYNATGDTLVYATYYGGYTLSPATWDYNQESFAVPNLMTVNKKGELIVAGTTGVTDMPTTTGCYSNAYKGGKTDMYVIHFNTAGSALLGSTYIGGSGLDGWNDYYPTSFFGWDCNKGEITTDAQGNIYICSATYSTDFPTTAGAYQTTNHGGADACVFKMDATCANLLFSTYLGGWQDESGFDMKLNADGNIVLSGRTQSFDFPATTGAFATSIYPNAFWNGFGDDGYISILKGDGSALLYSTFIGVTSNGTRCHKVEIDANGNIYTCGTFYSSDPNALHTSGTYYDTLGETFIAKFTPDLSQLQAATRIGVGFYTNSYNYIGNMYTDAFGLDRCGNVYYAGKVNASSLAAVMGLPLTHDNLISSAGYYNNAGDFWICSLSSDLSVFKYGTMLGGATNLMSDGTYRFDKNGVLYGYLNSTVQSDPVYSLMYPLTPNSYCKQPYGSYIFKLAVGSPIYPFSCTLNNDDSLCGEPITVSFTGTAHNVGSYLWNFGDGATGTTDSLPAVHQYALSGDYTATLVFTNSTDTLHCLPNDTTRIALHIQKPDTAYTSHQKALCSAEDSLVLKGASGFSNYLWYDGLTDSAQTITGSGTYWVRSTKFCTQHTDTLLVTQRNWSFNLGNDTSICGGELVLDINVPGVTQYFWNDTPASAQYTVRQTGLYKAEVSDGVCSSTDSIYVKIINLLQHLGNDTTVCTNDPVHITYTANTDAGAHTLWSTGSLENSITVGDSGLYWVLVTEDGCTYTDTAVVSAELCECHFEMPSAFTPNGDGKNDAFRPVVEPACIVQGAIFYVYNRWGQLVYTTTDIRKGWDGTQNGVPMPIDTYMYTIQFTGGTHQQQYQQKGDVTLIR